jgi:nucleotide-binding universal stress UspA family protein
MEPPVDTILVPTDGSDGAEAGIRRGIDLAASLEADLHILSVVDAWEPGGTLGGLEAEAETERENMLRKECQAAVSRASTLASGHLSGQITTDIEQGSPYRTITEYVETNNIDLVVMGTHGRSGLDRIVLGSVAEKTIRSAPIPVVAVPPAADIPEPGDSKYDDILLPTDGSKGAEVAIEWGIGLASVYDAMLHSVYSVESGTFGSTGGALAIYEAIKSYGRNALETVRERSEDAGVNVATNLGSGPPAEVIGSYAEDHEIDLIVMGTHGRSGVERYLIGSVTENVLRSTDQPVCTVPMPEDR